jgi:Na+/H+ antiporter NhaD/arsenite permease-like protein
MQIWLLVTFLLGYFFISTEHRLGIDKAATALVLGMASWMIIAAFGGEFHTPLEHAVIEIAEILFFLLGAMTIVGIIDAHDGFSIITDRISTKKASTLLIIITFISFFISAFLDNLTTTIVMIVLIRKLIQEEKMRFVFTGMVVVAANAGGAWSPIGDVTTTMLWIGGQLPDVLPFVKSIFIPAFISVCIPLLWFFRQIKGQKIDSFASKNEGSIHQKGDQRLVLTIGLLGLLLVPIIKEIFHLPPFVGMLMGLGGIWIMVEILIRKKPEEVRKNLRAQQVLTQIDTPSILFFLGILMAVSALSYAGILQQFAENLSQWFRGSTVFITSTIGLLSAIVDNVPLVAAAQGMYPIGNGDFGPNGFFWEMLAFTSGTGGSILIIGSAAGVAAMGMEKISFQRYLIHFSFPILLGYLAGVLTFWILS